MPKKTVRRGEIGFLFAGLVTVLLIFLPWTSTGLAADPESPQGVRPVQTGEVTGTGTGTGVIVIGNQQYLVMVHALIQTDEGRKRALTDVKPGEIVQYRLKNGVIDRLIVITRK